MGTKRENRISINISFDISGLLDQKAAIVSSFNSQFIIQDGFPIVSVEARKNETPKFLGFWVYGDGAEVNLFQSYAEIDFEILFNLSDSDSSYAQLSYFMKIIDRHYMNDYKAYYNSNGKVLKNIRHRFELMACYSILDIYEYSIREKEEFKPDVNEMFSHTQLIRLFREFRIPKRFAEHL